MMRLHFVLIFSITCMFLNASENNVVKNEFLVMIKPGSKMEQLLTILPEIKVVYQPGKNLNIWLVKNNSTLTPEQVLRKLKKNSLVIHAQYHHITEERSSSPIVPDDTYFSYQWNMNNTGSGSGIVGSDIDATRAWGISTSNLTADGDTIVVAVIDGRPNKTHEDINFFINYNEIDSNGIDDDGNGFIDDYLGWNANEHNGNVIGTSTHATHCSGIVGAVLNNNKGVVGVCPGVKILRVSKTSSVESQIVEAYDYVFSMRKLYNQTFGAKGAFVVSTNSSFGVDYGQSSNYPIWCAMYDSLGSVGIISAGATANLNINVDNSGDIPTTCQSDFLISVTNTNNQDNRNTGAAYGPANVDIGAPGSSIYSTIVGNNYSFSTGTSMATPHVAGAVALLFGNMCPTLFAVYKSNPDSIALLVKNIILESAEYNSSLATLTSSGSRLNIYRALLKMQELYCNPCSHNYNLEATAVLCETDTNGTVTIQGLNFTPAQIVWNTGDSAVLQLINLPAEYYSVEITDSNGCTSQKGVSIHKPGNVVINNIEVNPSAPPVHAQLAVQAVAGSEALQYSLDGNNFQPNNILPVDTAGTYVVYVKGMYGCIVSQTVIVSNVDENSIIQELNIGTFDNEWVLRFYANKNEEINLGVFDLNGKKLISEKLKTVSGTQSLVIKNNRFPSGNYYIIVEGNNSFKRVKVAKL